MCFYFIGEKERERNEEERQKKKDNEQIKEDIESK
jgi:hypothetical protein